MLQRTPSGNPDDDGRLSSLVSFRAFLECRRIARSDSHVLLPGYISSIVEGSIPRCILLRNEPARPIADILLSVERLVYSFHASALFLALFDFDLQRVTVGDKSVKAPANPLAGRCVRLESDAFVLARYPTCN